MGNCAPPAGSNDHRGTDRPRASQTVEVLAGLIAELDSATEAGEFYDHVCEALCRLTSMERAGLLLYDPATRAVRPVGSHGVDTGSLGEVEGTLDETPIAQRALAEDRVVEASGRARATRSRPATRASPGSPRSPAARSRPAGAGSG